MKGLSLRRPPAVSVAGLSGCSEVDPMMSESLTLKQVARRLGIPESTVRAHRDRFSSFIPVVGKGRSRRYPIAALDVFRMIAHSFSDGLSAEQVYERLRSNFAPTLDAETTSLSISYSAPVSFSYPSPGVLSHQEAQQLLTQVLDVEQRMAEMLAAVVQRQEELTSQLESMIGRLHARMDSDDQPQPQPQRPSLYDRLIGLWTRRILQRRESV